MYLLTCSHNVIIFLLCKGKSEDICKILQYMVSHMPSVPHMRCNVSVDTVAISSYVKAKHNTHGLARPYSDVERHSVLGAFASVGIQARAGGLEMLYLLLSVSELRPSCSSSSPQCAHLPPSRFECDRPGEYAPPDGKIHASESATFPERP